MTATVIAVEKIDHDTLALLDELFYLGKLRIGRITICTLEKGNIAWRTTTHQLSADQALSDFRHLT